jgi:hypothetical protein
MPTTAKFLCSSRFMDITMLGASGVKVAVVYEAAERDLRRWVRWAI